jgi:hypothetical protein
VNLQQHRFEAEDEPEDKERVAMFVAVHPYLFPITMAQSADIKNRFTYHPPQPGQQERYVVLREGGQRMAEMILMAVPEGPEQSIALRKLRECVMWSNAGIALEQSPREPQR